MKTYNIRPYSPPDELSVENLNMYWKTLLTAEASRKKTITIFIRDSKDQLRKQFASAANGFQETLNAVAGALSHLEGELEVLYQSRMIKLTIIVPIV